MESSSSLPEASILSTKRVVYVGGLSDKTDPSTVRAAFIPFGTIQSVDMPMDYESGSHKGFAFVEFRDAGDASEAVYNMDGAELMGRTLKVTLAQANQVQKLTEAVWKSDDWFQKAVGQDQEKLKELETQKHDGKTLQEA